MNDIFSAGDPLVNDPKLHQAFCSLPAFVQETIMQCNVDINNEQQLFEFADKLMRKD